MKFIKFIYIFFIHSSYTKFLLSKIAYKKLRVTFTSNIFFVIYFFYRNFFAISITNFDCWISILFRKFIENYKKILKARFVTISATAIVKNLTLN